MQKYLRLVTLPASVSILTQTLEHSIQFAITVQWSSTSMNLVTFYFWKTILQLFSQCWIFNVMLVDITTSIMTLRDHQLQLQLYNYHIFVTVRWEQQWLHNGPSTWGIKLIVNTLFWNIYTKVTARNIIWWWWREAGNCQRRRTFYASLPSTPLVIATSKFRWSSHVLSSKRGACF